MRRTGDCLNRLRPGRAGAVYALVLIVAMLLTVLALAGVSINRVNARSNGDSGDWSEAQLLAYSGAEHAMTQINAAANWRTTYSAQTVQKSLGNGTFSWQLADEIDGNLANDAAQAFVILATGTVRNATYTLHVAMTPGTTGLACGVSTPSTIALSSGAFIDSYNSTNGAYSWSTATANATVATNTTVANGVSLANNTAVKGAVSVGVGGNPNTVISDPGNVTGAKTALTQSVIMPTVTAPTGMGASSGDLSVGSGQTITINSNRHINELELSNGATINITGNVTILAEGPISLSQNSQIHVLPGASLKLYFKSSVTIQNNGLGIVVDGQNVSRLQLLGLGTGTVSLTNASMLGVLLAPNSPLVMSSGSEVFGAVAVKSVTMAGGGIHQDQRITSGVDLVAMGSTQPSKPKATAWSQSVN